MTSGEVVGQFPLHTNLEGMARCLGCLSDGEILQQADDEHIKGRGMTKAPEKDVTQVSHEGARAVDWAAA